MSWRNIFPRLPRLPRSPRYPHFPRLPRFRSRFVSWLAAVFIVVTSPFLLYLVIVAVIVAFPFVFPLAFAFGLARGFSLAGCCQHQSLESAYLVA